jgi:hypothetical protein
MQIIFNLIFKIINLWMQLIELADFI